MSFDGKQRLTVELDADFREQFDQLKDADVDVTVKKYRKKRSLSANAYAWVLIDKIAERQRMKQTDVYRNAIREIGGVSNIVCVQNRAVNELKRVWTRNGIGWQVEELDSKIPGCTNLILYKGSSEYDTVQMAALIDSLCQDARALGIETKPQEEIESMMKEYEKYAESHRSSGQTYERA